MYSECERLNPVLAFLWGKQNRVNMRSEQRPPEAQSYQSNSDAEISQHTLKEICFRIGMFVLGHTSAPRSKATAWTYHGSVFYSP